MKKSILLVTTLLVVFFLCGCSVLTYKRNLEYKNELQSELNKDNENSSKTTIADAPSLDKFDIEYYNISVLTPKEKKWKDVTEGSPFDLQLTDGSAYFSVMVYYSIDLAAEQTPEAIYDWHNEDIFSRRDNVEIIEDKKTSSNLNRVITKKMYSAEFNGTKNYYGSYLVSFNEGEVFSWVLISAVPSQMLKNQEDYEAIVETMMLNY